MFLRSASGRKAPQHKHDPDIVIGHQAPPVQRSISAKIRQWRKRKITFPSGFLRFSVNPQRSEKTSESLVSLL